MWPARATDDARREMMTWKRFIIKPLFLEFAIESLEL